MLVANLVFTFFVLCYLVNCSAWTGCVTLAIVVYIFIFSNLVVRVSLFSILTGTLFAMWHVPNSESLAM